MLKYYNLIYSEHAPSGNELFGHVPTFQDVILKFEQGGPEILAGLDNLQRLLLTKLIIENAQGKRVYDEAEQQLDVIAYGEQFMLAVTPPTA